MKSLSSLLKNIPHKADVIPEIEISSVCYNSKNAASGSLFVCIRGTRADGHDYAQSAYDRGSRAFLCERKLPLPPDAVQIITDDCRAALADVSAEFFSHPEKEIKVIGITGTKGKSTVAHMVRHILESSGIKTGLIGTCGITVGDRHYPTENTTPESYELFRALREMVDNGCKCAAIEVSSQAMLMGRVRGIPFFAAVMTNLSPDHIGPGEHLDFENYKNCKKALFSLAENAVLNADDSYFGEFSVAARNVVTYSINSESNFRATELSSLESTLGKGFTVIHSGLTTPACVPFPGDFSVYNSLAAIATCSLLGVTVKSCTDALPTVSVPGRFETVSVPGSATFVIDYAHNGESLEKAIDALKECSPLRLICLFGSVGCRTQLRRRSLGKAASQADFCIITSDNPDTENPEKIIDEIAENVTAPYTKFTGREDAIRYDVEISEPGDIVLLAGKGHENYQLIDRKKLPFDERELVMKYLGEKIKV